MPDSIKATPIDCNTVLATGVALLLLLLVTVWWNQYLPMQDFPQHLFMAEVASSYDDPAYDWRDNFELRQDFGPYRASSMALQVLSSAMDIQTGGKVLASLYVLLVGFAAYRCFADSKSSTAPWGVLLFFPLCFHAMYFYGFFNFTLSIPVLLLTLLQLRKIICEPHNTARFGVQSALVVFLFLLHPTSFQVYIVLAACSAVLLGWGRRGFWLGMGYAVAAALLFTVWSISSAAMSSGDGKALTLESLGLTWWPLEWTARFLAMSFTGLRIVETPVWWVASIWAFVLVPVIAGLWQARIRHEYSIGLVWFALLFLFTLAGYFVLPFRLQTDIYHTYFNARLAPIALFLFAAFTAGLPIPRMMGRLLCAACLVLTAYSANLHHRVATELETSIPIFDKMEPNASVLPLWTNSPSAVLDPFFYTNFYSHFPFYYHLLKGGGRNPMLFSGELMPVAYRDGKRPTRILWDKIQGKRFEEYDYILTTRIPGFAVRQLNQMAIFLDEAGSWRLYKVKETAPPPCCLNPDWQGSR